MAKIADIDSLLKEMDKKFGQNSLIEFGDEVASVEALTTGLPSLDLATGIGGFPRGRVVEVFGPEGAGKTTIILKAMAEAQRNVGKKPRSLVTMTGVDVKPLTGRCGFIDMEHAFDPSLAKLHGVQMGKGSGFHFAQPNSGVEALEMAEYMVNSGLFDIIAIDSVAALTSNAEVQGDIGDIHMAPAAQLMSQALRQLVPMINKSQTCVIFINQIREKPAVKYGSPETTPGGRALKFYASMRLRVSRKESLKEGSLQVGHEWHAKIVKNKCAPPFTSTTADLYYRDVESKGKLAGFDIFSDLIETAKRTGVIRVSGSQYQYADKETGEYFMKANGLVQCKAFLTEHPNIFEMIVDEMLRSGGAIADGEDDGSDE